MALLGDLRYALRALRRSPGYALTCVAVLALGIGANAAIFSVIHSVILKALPYPDASRLVFVWERFPHASDPLFGRIPVARKNYLEWRRQSTVFDDMAAFRAINLSESGVDRPRYISTGFGSPNLFPMLGVRARIGRLFTPDEERRDADRVAVITDAYFKSRFHRDAKAIGKSIALGGVAYTVIGVLPSKFHLPATSEGFDQLKPEVWVPLSRLWNKAEDDTSRQLLVSGRLKPGVSLAQARTEMAGIAARLGQADPNLNEGWTASVFPFAVEDTAPNLHRALWVLLAAVGFLLLAGRSGAVTIMRTSTTVAKRRLST